MGGEDEEGNWSTAIAIGTPRDLCTAVSTGAAAGGGISSDIGDASFNGFDNRDAAEQFDLTPRSISHEQHHQHQGDGGGGGGRGGGGAPGWNANSRVGYWGAEDLGIGGSDGGGGGGRAGTTALDTIVTSFLRNQHERCPDPVCVLPRVRQ